MQAEGKKVTFTRIFILGAGAIGSIIGTALSKEIDVTLIGNKSHVDVVNSQGLTISGDIKGTFQINAETHIRKIPSGTLIFLSTKAYDSEKAIAGINTLLRKETVIVVLQNGLGNEVAIRRIVNGKCKVLRAVTGMAAEFFKAGHVRYWKGETVIERDPAGIDIAQTMNSCGLETSVTERFKEKLWTKAAVNSVVNPLTAIFRVRNCEIVAKSLAPVRHQIVRECIDVGRKEGVVLQDRLEKKVDNEIGSYKNYSSMYQDVIKGKKTEIDFLNGKIVELGRKNHVPTPVNETMYNLVKYLEEKNEVSRHN